MLSFHPELWDTGKPYSSTTEDQSLCKVERPQSQEAQPPRVLDIPAATRKVTKSPQIPGKELAESKKQNRWQHGPEICTQVASANTSRGERDVIITSPRSRPDLAGEYGCHPRVAMNPGTSSVPLPHAVPPTAIACFARDRKGGRNTRT